MERTQWERVSDIFDAAAGRSSDERDAFLSSACDGDEEVRQEVVSLLRFENASVEFLERPAVRVAPDVRGRQLGPYTILAPLGVGGMGEVYRAHDSKLGRDVAIKILPPRFTGDPERCSRFAREARALATLNHPHIGAIYGLEESSGITALVLELVEGPTLAECLERGPLPIADALTIAGQVAQALEAAHKGGIIHRDLKPANVVLQRPAGSGDRARDFWAKVLDFGLAKSTDETDAGDGFEAPATLYSTAIGRVLGTPAYMSPEQARGHRVDTRTDIWSYGCLLFEMLSGKRAFDGASPADTVAAILEREPDWAALPSTTPESVRTLLRHCLEKEPAHRLGDIAEAQQKLEPAEPPPPPVREPGPERRYRAHGRVFGSGAAVSILAVLWWVWLGQGPADLPLQISRLTYEPGLQTNPAMSPDGQVVAYASNREGNFDLYVQAVGGGNAVRVTDHPAHDWQPDWSVNAQIVFRSERDDGGLYVVSPTGGHEQRVAGFGEWPVWSPGGTKVLFRNGPSLLLHTVGLDGAPPQGCKECFGGAYGWFGDAHIVTFSTGQERQYQPRLRQIDLDSGSVHTWSTSRSVDKGFLDLGVSVGRTTLAWDPSGRAFYFAGFSGGTSAIWRVDVDPGTRSLTGGPHRVAATAEVGTSVSVARTSGALAFAAASSIPRISWYRLDQSGRRITGPPESLTSRELPPADADLTPDGSRLIFTVRRPGGTTVELRTRLLAEPSERPLLVTSTTHGERRQQPLVSPDGRHVVYRYVHPESTGVSGTHNFLLPQQLRLLDIGTTQESELTQTASRFIMPGGFTPDGRFVVASVDLRPTPNQSMSIALFPIAAAPKADAQMRVVTTRQGDSGLLRPSMSPDGRWIAFEVQGHTAQIAVVGSADGLWQETQAESGWRYLDPLAMYDPHWSADGRLLYFVSARRGVLNVWAVDFDLASGKAGAPFQVTEFDGQAHLIPLSTEMIAVARHGLAIRTSHPNGGIWLVHRR